LSTRVHFAIQTRQTPPDSPGSLPRLLLDDHLVGPGRMLSNSYRLGSPSQQFPSGSRPFLHAQSKSFVYQKAPAGWPAQPRCAPQLVFMVSPRRPPIIAFFSGIPVKPRVMSPLDCRATFRLQGTPPNPSTYRFGISVVRIQIRCFCSFRKCAPQFAAPRLMDSTFPPRSHSNRPGAQIAKSETFRQIRLSRYILTQCNCTGT